MKHIFYERDPINGLQREYTFDGKNLTERTSAIPGLAQKIVDNNARMANDGDYKRRGSKSGLQHIGRIPSEVWIRWMNEGFNIFTAHPEDIRRKLRDRDYSKLRVVDGKI
jgi:hypothetical protein